MANGLYDGSIESIPGLGGFVQQTKLNQAQTGQNIQNGAALMQMLQAQKAAAEQDQVRQVLSAGGDPNQVVQKLLKSGQTGLQAAQHYVTVNQAVNSQKMLQGLDLTNPDALDRAGVTLAMQGHPAGGAMTALAEKIRQRQANVAEHQSQMGVETPIGETPQTGFANGAFADRSAIPAGGATVPATVGVKAEPIPQEVAAAMASGRPFSIGVGPTDQTQRVGGLFQSFADSPISVIRNNAGPMQTAVNASNPQAIPPKTFETQANQLGLREANLAQAQALGGMRNDTQNRRIDATLRVAGLNPDGSLPAAGEALAQAIAANQVDPPSGAAATHGAGQAVMARVLQINPDYSKGIYQGALANDKSMAAGKLSDKVKAFNTATLHLQQLGELADALNNGNMQLANEVGNKIALWSGDANPNNLESLKNIVGPEISASIIAGGGTGAERDAALKTLAGYSSPSQFAGAINTYKNAMGAQLLGLEQQYKNGGGKQDFSKFLLPEAKMSYLEEKAKYGGGGGGTDFPVTSPDGVVHHFPSAAAAQGFKAAAGIK